MHIDTIRQAWQALQRCGFRQDSYPKPLVGKVVHIAHFEESGVCAKVEFDRPYNYDWYQYDRGRVTKLPGSPRGRESGVIPPGCSL